jgi:hypothetical protein
VKNIRITTGNIEVKNVVDYLKYDYGIRKCFKYLRPIYRMCYVLHDSILIQFKDSVHCAI